MVDKIAGVSGFFQEAPSAPPYLSRAEPCRFAGCGCSLRRAPELLIYPASTLRIVRPSRTEPPSEMPKLSECILAQPGTPSEEERQLMERFRVQHARR